MQLLRQWGVTAVAAVGWASSENSPAALLSQDSHAVSAWELSGLKRS